MRITIPLSRTGDTLSRQIHHWLRTAILEGALPPGERLPSTRDLADQHSISRTAVLVAYDQLLAEGFIESRTGSGSYVAAGMAGGSRAREKGGAKLKLSRFGVSAAEAAAQVSVPARRAKPLRYDFVYGRSAIGEFPFEEWRRILARRARAATVRSLDYGSPGGSAALREALAAHLRRSRSVECDPDQVIVVNGSQQSLDLAARILTEPGDSVAIENPHYQGAREILRAAGARLRPVAVDSDGMDTARLPARARLVYVTPSHQFPCGAVLPLARRLALLEWAKRANAAVIEDDYDGEFRYEGQPVESLQGLDSEGRVIYIGTFSKTIFPALRLGYLIAPKRLAEAFRAAKWLCDRHTPTLEQETLAEFIASGAYERHLRRARRRNADRRSALLESAAKHIGDRAALTGAGSGTHVVLWPAGRASEAELVSRAAAREVGVYGVAPYYLGSPPRAGLLLGYSGMTEAAIREGVRRLAEVF